MFYVSHHPDDLTHLFAGIVSRESGFDAFANYILAREKFVGKALVHYHDRR